MENRSVRAYRIHDQQKEVIYLFLSLSKMEKDESGYHNDALSGCGETSYDAINSLGREYKDLFGKELPKGLQILNPVDAEWDDLHKERL